MTKVVDDILDLDLQETELSDLVEELSHENYIGPKMEMDIKNGIDYYESVKKLKLTDTQVDELMAEIEGSNKPTHKVGNSQKVICPQRTKVLSRIKLDKVNNNTKKKINKSNNFQLLIGVQENQKLRNISEKEAETLFSSLQSEVTSNEVFNCQRASFQRVNPNEEEKEFIIEFGDAKSLSWFQLNINKYLHNAIVLPPSQFRERLKQKYCLFYAWRLVLPGFLRNKNPISITQALIKSNNIRGAIDIACFTIPATSDGTCYMTWFASPLADVFLKSCKKGTKTFLYFGILPIETKKLTYKEQQYIPV